jgi:uncharacterized membrane protein (UPF0127 family)
MRIIYKILILIIAIIVFAYLFFYSTDILLAPSSDKDLAPEVCFGPPAGGNCFLVELARTQEELSKGLMGRQQLGKNRGMLFIFSEEAVRPFWMKNTLISLDIIWIDKNNKIVFIKENAEPCPPALAEKQIDCPMIDPGLDAKYVLEINAGISKSLDLKIGDTVKIK